MMDKRKTEKDFTIRDGESLPHVQGKTFKEKVLNLLHIKDTLCSAFTPEQKEKARTIIVKTYRNSYLFPFRKTKEFPLREKDWEELSLSSRSVYVRTMQQLIKEMGRHIAPIDVVCRLLETAKQKSRSRYYTEKAVFKKICRNRPDFITVINLLPPYGKLLEELDVAKKTRAGEITNARRSEKDIDTLCRLIRGLPTKYHRPLLGMVLCGARKTELPSLKIATKIYQGRKYVTLSIKNSKIGCRAQFFKEDDYRHLLIPINTGAGRFWLETAENLGNTPFVNIHPPALESAWRRSRKRAGVENDQAWCFHALRHAFCSSMKNRLKTLSKDKRRKLITDVMGHNRYEISSIYGNSRNANVIDPAIVEVI